MTPYELALKEVGTVEWKDGSNPKVLAYYRDAGHGSVSDDAVPWCAAFVGAMFKRAGMKGTGMLTARSYLDWGVPVKLADAQEGDIAVFKRGNSAWQGHVAFFVRQAGSKIEVLGGNQSDAVNVSRYLASSLLGIRRASTAVAAKKPAPTAVKERPVQPVQPSPPLPAAKPLPTGWLAILLALLAAGAAWIGVK